MTTKRTNRFVLDLRKGAVIEQNEQRYVITHTLNMTQMMVKHMTTGEAMILDVSTLEPPKHATEAAMPQQDRDLAAVDQEEWAHAELIRDALEQSLVADHGSASYEKLADSVALSRAKFYKLRRRYLESGKLLSSLLHAYWPSAPPPTLIEGPHMFRFEPHHPFCLQSSTDRKGLSSGKLRKVCINRPDMCLAPV